MPPRVQSLQRTPAYTFAHRIAAPGGTSRLEVVPVLTGVIENLPPLYDVLICASDLQGVAPDDPAQLSGIGFAQELAVWLECEGILPSRALVLLAGDFYSAPGATTRGASGEVDAVWLEWSRHFGDVVGIAGNHDRFCADFASQCDSHSHFLNGENIKLNGLTIAGWSGVVVSRVTSAKHTIGPDSSLPSYVWSENEFLSSWRKMRQHSPDIVLVHETPLWPDREIGSAVVQSLLAEEEKLNCCAKLLVSGHVRWQEPLRNLNNGSQVLACDGRIFVLKRI